MTLFLKGRFSGLFGLTFIWSHLFRLLKYYNNTQNCITAWWWSLVQWKWWSCTHFSQREVSESLFLITNNKCASWSTYMLFNTLFLFIFPNMKCEVRQCQINVHREEYSNIEIRIVTYGYLTCKVQYYIQNIKATLNKPLKRGSHSVFIWDLKWARL